MYILKHQLRIYSLQLPIFHQSWEKKCIINTSIDLSGGMTYINHHHVYSKQKCTYLLVFLPMHHLLGFTHL